MLLAARRASGLTGLAYTDTSVSAGNTYTYQVAAEVSGGEATRSGLVTPTGALTSLAPQAAPERSLATFASSAWEEASGAGFTDDPLVPGVTPVKAVHLVELRGRIDALRLRLGLPGFGWTDAVIEPGVTPARAVHLTELRWALVAAYGAAGRTAPVYTDAGATPGVTPMRAEQLQELRVAVVVLEKGLAQTRLPSPEASRDARAR